MNYSITYLKATRGHIHSYRKYLSWICFLTATQECGVRYVCPRTAHTRTATLVECKFCTATGKVLKLVMPAQHLLPYKVFCSQSGNSDGLRAPIHDEKGNYVNF